MNKILFFLFYVFCFFPYIRIIPINTDTQLNALIISCLIIILNMKSLKNNIKKEFLLLFIVMIMSWIVGIIEGINFNSFRSIFNYVSIFCIPISTYIIVKKENGIRENLIKRFIWIWFWTGVIQTFIYPKFLSFLVLRSSTSIGRGVTSLATEPTFYGCICIFMMVFVFMFHSEKKKYILILMIQIVFLAKSSMATLLVVCFSSIIYIIKSCNIKSIISNIILIGIVLFCAHKLLMILIPESRVFNHITQVLNSPKELLFNDESVSQRASSIYFSVKGGLKNLLFPNGYNSFKEYMNIEIMNNIIPFSSIARGNRIMSGLGACIYELGFGGVIIMYTMMTSVRKNFINNRLNIAISCCLFIIMFMAITIGLPLLGVIMGVGIFNREKNYNFKK